MTNQNYFQRLRLSFILSPFKLISKEESQLPTWSIWMVKITDSENIWEAVISIIHKYFGSGLGSLIGVSLLSGPCNNRKHKWVKLSILNKFIETIFCPSNETSKYDYMMPVLRGKRIIREKLLHLITVCGHLAILKNLAWGISNCLNAH